eukprot:symbB.v1.2.038228.t1/scaffold5884.1/size22780/2
MLTRRSSGCKQRLIAWWAKCNVLRCSLFPANCYMHFGNYHWRSSKMCCWGHPSCKARAAEVAPTPLEGYGSCLWMRYGHEVVNK